MFSVQYDKVVSWIIVILNVHVLTSIKIHGVNASRKLY